MDGYLDVKYSLWERECSYSSVSQDPKIFMDSSYTFPLDMEMVTPCLFTQLLSRFCKCVIRLNNTHLIQMEQGF